MNPAQIEAVTKGMSRNGADMWRIAVRFAGFEPVALLSEITRRQRGYQKITEPTVLAAMQTLEDRYRAAHPEEYVERDRLRAEALVKIGGQK
jgi:hypothetical protein